MFALSQHYEKYFVKERVNFKNEFKYIYIYTYLLFFFFFQIEVFFTDEVISERKMKAKLVELFYGKFKSVQVLTLPF